MAGRIVSKAHGEWGLPYLMEEKGWGPPGSAAHASLLVKVKTQSLRSDAQAILPHRSGLCLLTDKTSWGTVPLGSRDRGESAAYPVPQGAGS